MSLHILELATVRWYNACAEYAVRVSVGLAARGHRVVLGGFPGSPPVSAARDAGLPVVDAFDFQAGRLDFPGTLLRFRRYLRESRFDIVNAHRAEDHLFAALALAGTDSVPVVRTRGDVRPPRTHWLNRRLYEKHTAAHILAAGFMRQRYYGRFRIPPDRVVTLKPGVDVDHFRTTGPDRVEARSRLGIPAGSPVAGLIGRFTAAKGQLTALDAFARVRERLPRARFLVSGAPYDVSEGLLRERASYLNLGDSILFRPPAADVRQLIRAIDVGVVASTDSEAICRIAMEYQASGVPVVGTDLNSIPEMVLHGSTGLIVPPGNAEALAAGIQRLLEDHESRERMAEAGIAHMRKEYGPGRLIDGTEALYKRLIRETSQ